MEKTKESVATNNSINREGIQQQAERMLQRTVRKYPDALIGSNVKIKIPTVDRTRIDFSNLLGVVMEVKGDFPMYKIGTKIGVLQNYYNRKDLTIISEVFLLVADVPDKIVELRTAASDASLFGGQGMALCNCRSNCGSNTCGCRKKGLNCTSSCHKKNDSCINKDKSI